MKKYIPYTLVVLGLLVVVVAVGVVVKTLKGSVEETKTEEDVVTELPVEQRPAISLVPTGDPNIPNSYGRILKLKVEKINVPKAATLDYLFTYTTQNGGQQGGSGTIKLSATEVEKNLLLGSESSGKYRFDSGVSLGSIMLTFRDESGKSLGKVESQFHLQVGETELTSADNLFKYSLDKKAKDVAFVTMQTFLQPKESENLVVWQNGYGVFSLDGKPHSGQLN